MASMKDYWSAIFEPLIIAASRPDLAAKLKTAALPTDIEADQIAKLKLIKAFPNDTLELPQGGFVCRYRIGSQVCLCLQSSSLSALEKRDIETYLDGFGATSELLDESTFMFLALEYSNVYKPRKEHLSGNGALSLLAVADQGEYEGHAIDDLVVAFEEVMIFTIEDTSVISNCSKWFLGALLTSSSKAFRVETFPVVLAEKLNDLLLLGNANPENIYYATTSIHLRQCYMEIYRCIEGAFYLPWTNALKASLGLQGSGRLIAGQLKNDIKWRQKESESIRKLFAMASSAVVVDPVLSHIRAFGDINFDEVNSDVISKRIYKIRNILVHQEDYDDPTPIVVSSDCWPVLNLFLASVAFDLYSKFATELDFSYEIEVVA